MSLNSYREPLRDSTNFIYLKAPLQIKDQNIPQKKITLVSQDNKVLQDNKGNKPSGPVNKIKLKLKSYSSRDTQRKVEHNQNFSTKNQAQKHLRQVNHVTKNITRQLQLPLKMKQKKTTEYFKPQMINFSLKSLRQNKIQTVQNKLINNEANNSGTKERQNVKNYPLSGFISQIVSTLYQLIPNIVEQPNLDNIFSHPVDYSHIIEILHSLCMIYHSSQVQYKVQHQDQKEQLQKIYLLWRILKSPHNEHSNIIDNTNILNLVILLTSIVNISLRSIEQLKQVFVQKLNHLLQKKKTSKALETIQKTEKSKQPTQIFLIRNKKIIHSITLINCQGQSCINLDERSNTEIYKEFAIFRINRLNIQNTAKISQNYVQSNNQNLQYEFCSLMSPKSQQLAMTKRIKILQQLKSYNSQEKYQNSQLNVFLNYKSSKKSQNDSQINQTSIKNNQNQLKNNMQSKATSKTHPDISIPSKKIKFSDLNVVKNMEKARQLKQQKQIILSTGWTNNGKITSRSSNINSTQSIKCKQFNESSINKVKSPQSKKNFFESRKNSFNSSNKINLAKDVNMKNYESSRNNQYFIECNDQSEETIRQIQILQKISEDTISIHQNESSDFDNQIFTNLDNLQFQNLSELQKYDSQTQQNKPQTVQHKHILTEQTTNNHPTECKTFNTEQNQLPQEQSSQSRQSQRQSKQNRVIKSYLKIPILYVDVNMDESRKQRIIIYEEDDPNLLAKQFGKKHGLDMNMIKRLEDMLTEQIGGILGRIDEEDDEYDDTKQDIFNNQQSLQAQHQ